MGLLPGICRRHVELWLVVGVVCISFGMFLMMQVVVAVWL